MSALVSAAEVRTAAAAALAGSAPLRPALEAIVARIPQEVMDEGIAAGSFGGDAFPAMLADAIDMLDDDESLALWLGAVL